MSEDEADWRIRDWLFWSVQPQDSVSVHDKVVEEDPEEPMIRANHGVSDQHTCERMWRHAQCQTDRNGKPRIPLQLNISRAPDA